MRPRVFPAEDVPDVGSVRRADRFNEAAGIPRGRRFLRINMKPMLGVASMRPRVFPAEDPIAGCEAVSTPLASMRPRVFPAEDDGGGGGRRSKLHALQ